MLTKLFLQQIKERPLKLTTSLSTGLSIVIALASPISLAEVEGITTGSQLQAKAEKLVTNISTDELVKVLDTELDMILIDVRMPSEISNMGGAIKAEQNTNIPRGWLEYRVTRVALSKDTLIVVYCGAGIRTPMAAARLQEMGYTNVKNYADGFLGWRKAGLPVATE
jgi:rhodanese-related sulfurtransferase